MSQARRQAQATETKTEETMQQPQATEVDVDTMNRGFSDRLAAIEQNQQNMLDSVNQSVARIVAESMVEVRRDQQRLGSQISAMQSRLTEVESTVTEPKPKSEPAKVEVKTEVKTDTEENKTDMKDKVKDGAKEVGEKTAWWGRRTWNHVKKAKPDRHQVNAIAAANLAEYFVLVSVAQINPVATLNFISTALFI